MLPSLTHYIHNNTISHTFCSTHIYNFIFTCSDVCPSLLNFRKTCSSLVPNFTQTRQQMSDRCVYPLPTASECHEAAVIWRSADKTFIFILCKYRLTREITLNHEHHEFQVGSCFFTNSNNDSTIALLNMSDCCFTVKGEAGHSYVYEIYCNY
jgi:hypothetical protein